jgi:hypothetical protein
MTFIDSQRLRLTLLTAITGAYAGILSRNPRMVALRTNRFRSGSDPVLKRSATSRQPDARW